MQRKFKITSQESKLMEIAQPIFDKEDLTLATTKNLP